MIRDQTTGRFVKEEKPNTSPIENSFHFSYTTLAALFLLSYPWLVIIINNYGNILTVIKHLNKMIISNIKDEADLS